MKRIIFFIAVFLGIKMPVYAQISYGVGAGLNLGSLTNFRQDEKEYRKPLASFYLNAYADLALSSLFSIQAGLSLQGKGHKLKGTEDGVTYQESVDLMSLEIPINAVFQFPTKVGSIYIGAGPFIGYYLSGKYKEKMSGAGSYDYSESEKIHFSGDNKDLNPIEAGLNGMIGFKFNQGYLINIGYGLGLTQLDARPDQKTMSSRVFRFGVGYQF